MNAEWKPNAEWQLKPEWQLRREMVAIGRRLYERRYVVASDGNISVRAGRDRYLVTPSGSCLGELHPQDMICIDGRRQVLAGALRPTSELLMHLAVYAMRPQIEAVIHAHPVNATALSVAGITLNEPVLPEVVLYLDTIPTAPYATLASEASAAAVRELIATHDALILDRHGTLTIGADLECAFRKLEKLEHCAEVVALAHRLGRVQILPPDEVARLRSKRPAPDPPRPLARVMR